MNLKLNNLPVYLKSGPALNLWAGYFCFASVAIYGICSIPLAVRFLNKEELGLWVLITQVVGYLIFLELGVGACSGRTLASPLASGIQEEIDKAWSTIVVLLSVMGLAMAIVGLSLQPLILEYFKIPSYLHTEAFFVLSGSILINALLVPLRGASGVLLCQERYYWSLIIQGVLPWINFFSFAIFLLLGLGMRSYVYSGLIVAISQYFWFNYLLSKGPHKIRFRPRLVSFQTIKPILGYSSSMIMWSLAPALLASVPPLVIARHVGLDQVTIYNVTSRVPTMMGTLAMRIYSSFFPRMQSLYISGNLASFLPLYRFASNLSVWSLGVFLTVAILVNPFAVDFLARPDFYGGTLVTTFFIIGIFSVGVGEHLGNLFIFAGKPKLISIILGIEIVVAYTSAVLASTRFGIIGVAASVALAPLVCRIPYYILFGPRTCGYNFFNLYGPSSYTICCFTMMASSGFLIAKQSSAVGPYVIAILLLIIGITAGILSIRATIRDFKSWKHPS